MALRLIAMIFLLPLFTARAVSQERVHCEPIMSIIDSEGFLRDDNPKNDIHALPLDSHFAPSRSDTVSMYVEISIIQDEYHDIFMRSNGNNMPLSASENGIIQELGFADQLDMGAELCATFPNDADLRIRLPGGIKLRNPDTRNIVRVFNVNTKFVFRGQSGLHSISELYDGLRDTRWRLVEMTPLPRFFARRLFPKNRFIRITAKRCVSGVDKCAGLVTGFTSDGSQVDFDAVTSFEVDALAKMGIQAIEVSSENYYLEAVPSSKDLADTVAELRSVSPQQQRPNNGSD